LQNISDGQATNQATNKRCFLCVVLLLISLIVANALMFWYFANSRTDRENGFKHLPTIYLPNVNDSTFFGRHWLFQELEDRINSSRNNRGILIVGEPGLGKSSIMRQLIITSESTPFIHRNIIAYHFCKFDENETRSVGLLVKKIIFLFAQKIPEMAVILRNDKSIENELEKCENYPHSCFKMALLEPLQNLTKPPTITFIVIDALDECREISDDSHDSPILQFLHSKGTNLPNWIKFIFRSRNITTVIGKLSEIDVSNYTSSQQTNVTCWTFALLEKNF
jgi:GTPase SAR1 family protein